MLIEKIDTTLQVFNKVKEFERQKDEYERFENIKKEILTIKSNILKVLKTYKALREWDSSHFKARDFSLISNKLQAIKEKLKDREVPSYLETNEIQKRLDEQEEQLKQEYRDWVGKQSNDVLRILNNIKELTDNKEEINDIERRIREVKSKWPISKNDLERLEQKLEKGRTIITQLGLDKDIQNFLQLVTTRRATVKDLTPEIITWLQDYNFTDKLRITF